MNAANDNPALGDPKPVKLRPQAAWCERNPLKRWAHKALESGRRRGLVQQQPCEVCGEPKSEAHHDDYDRPLVVRWLCRKHHKAIHAAERMAQEDAA